MVRVVVVVVVVVVVIVVVVVVELKNEATIRPPKSTVMFEPASADEREINK